MGRKATPEADLRRRKRDWSRARGCCPLTHAGVAAIVGRSEDTVRKYSMRNGLVPTWDVITALQTWNLNQALDILGDRFGEEAVTRFRNEDADAAIGLRS